MQWTFQQPTSRGELCIHILPQLDNFCLTRPSGLSFQTDSFLSVGVQFRLIFKAAFIFYLIIFIQYYSKYLLGDARRRRSCKITRIKKTCGTSLRMQSISDKRIAIELKSCLMQPVKALISICADFSERTLVETAVLLVVRVSHNNLTILFQWCLYFASPCRCRVLRATLLTAVLLTKINK